VPRVDQSPLPVRDQFLPFHRPCIGDEEIAAVGEVLRSGWLTTGKQAQALQEAFARELGVPHALAVNSCTAALHLALELFRLAPGDEVLLPTTTFASTANVVVHAGATPVFCDIDPETLTLDPADAEARITERTRAIIAVHLAGHPCDMTRLGALAARHQLFLLEDAAHAIETVYDGRRAGAFGDAAAFSFYATKTLTTGEGGMLTVGDQAWLDEARALSLHGLSKDAWRRYDEDGGLHYEVVAAGYKYNMPDVLAAIGVQQLRKVEKFYARRRQLVERYTAGLAGLPLRWQPIDVPGGRHAHHLFMIVLDDAVRTTRDALATELRARRIGTSLHFLPLHGQPFYRPAASRQAPRPVAEQVAGRALSLPLFPDMTDADVDYVVSHLRDALAAG